MAIDFKKLQKDLYQPTITPTVVDVASMVFIAVDGQGDPNTSEEYAAEKLKTVIRHPIRKP